ncbi:hypothetical protein N431DRAFT_290357, partial [Stipitochalara longipes BDJ]
STQSTGAGAGSSETDINFTSTFNGRPLLTGTCGTPTFTPVPNSVISPYLWLAFVGCLEERLDCCPFSESPQGVPGFSMYDQAVPTGGPTPCVSSLESPLKFSTSTTGGSSYTPAITEEVFAISLPLQPHGGLSTGSKAGIGVGVAVCCIAIFSAIWFWWRVRNKNSKRQPPEVVAPASENKNELDGHQVSEAPPNYHHSASDHVSPTNMQEYQLRNENVLDSPQVSEVPDNSGHFPSGHTASTVTQRGQVSELYGDQRV